MDNIGLNVTSIRLPAKSQFPELIEQLVNACHVFRHLKKKPSSKAQVDRYLHCHTLIEQIKVIGKDGRENWLPDAF